MAASTPSPTTSPGSRPPKSAEVSPTSRPIDAPPSQVPGQETPSQNAAAAKWPGAPLVLPDPSTISLDNVRAARKSSIQIKPHAVMSGEPKRRPTVENRRRMSSPPPPPVFRPRVSFDTIEKIDKKDLEKKDDNAEPPSFTVSSKHKDYEYSKRSRTFLCGLDSNDYSDYALEWLIEELVDDGDEIVCLRVVEPESAERQLTDAKYREIAEVLLKKIESKNHENKAINLVLELAIGKVERVIKRMIEFYEPAMLIVGTRGRSLGGFQGLLPGSISKFCLQNSAVPVIVVRPGMQRSRGKKKRMNDPARSGYRDLLDRAGIDGHLLHESNRYSVDQLGGREEERPASSDESAAVAAAFGFRQPLGKVGSTPLTKVESAATDTTNNTDSEVGSEAEVARLMKSPQMQGMESPELSGDSAFGDDDEDGGASSGPPSPELINRQAPNLIVRRPTGEAD